MRLSSEKLAIEAESTGFRQDVLEKIAHLLGLLNTLQSHPFLKGKLVLKGGSRYQPEALWYLGLCHLKTGAFEKANTVLGELEHYDGLYQEDAQLLRKKLRRLK